MNCCDCYKKSAKHLTYASALVLSCDYLGQWGITINIVTNIFVRIMKSTINIIITDDISSGSGIFRTIGNFFPSIPNLEEPGR